MQGGGGRGREVSSGRSHAYFVSFSFGLGKEPHTGMCRVYNLLRATGKTSHAISILKMVRQSWEDDIAG